MERWFLKVQCKEVFYLRMRFGSTLISPLRNFHLQPKKILSRPSFRSNAPLGDFYLIKKPTYEGGLSRLPGRAQRMEGAINGMNLDINEISDKIISKG
jgi:hypothetical protein